MAPAVEPRPLVGDSGSSPTAALANPKGARKDAPGLIQPVAAPPSPPPTETDDEESDEPYARGQGQGLPSRPALSILGASETVEGQEAAAAAALEAFASGSPVLSPVTSPPYWMNSNGHHTHRRTVSNLSTDSIPAGGITLQDNDLPDGHPTSSERNSACWARAVAVTDHVVVNGSSTNIGAFVVWNVRVETLSGSSMDIRKRYSEFDDFRWRLVQTFPAFEAAVPELPPKSLISKFRPAFLEKRRAGLQYFLNCILLNPEFSGSPVLKEFLFA